MPLSRLVARAGRVVSHPRRSFASYAFRRANSTTREQANRFFFQTQSWATTYWLGTRTAKNPLDAWVMQEIISETRPELLIETGTNFGGSALFFASVFDFLGAAGEVVSVDLRPLSPALPVHPRITYYGGRSSTDPEVLAEVRRHVEGKRTMVVLDSDHSSAHVLRELELYSPFVSPGLYLIVEDTATDTYFRKPDGPMRAVRDFLARSSEFTVDSDREKHLITFNPGGYLRRIDDSSQSA
jgi:cephalosporin hydroxylase